jgi:hypothetical protein
MLVSLLFGWFYNSHRRTRNFCEILVSIQLKKRKYISKKHSTGTNTHFNIYVQTRNHVNCTKPVNWGSHGSNRMENTVGQTPEKGLPTEN